MPAGEAFSERQLRRIEDALNAAMEQTELVFSLFVGDVDPRAGVPAPAEVAVGVGAVPPRAGDREVSPRAATGNAAIAGDEIRAVAERLHAALGEHAAEAVFLLVAPGQRRLEIVTGELARQRIPDQTCALASLSMTTSFAGGDLVGGILTGVRMLSEAAGRPHEQRGA